MAPASPREEGCGVCAVARGPERTRLLMADVRRYAVCAGLGVQDGQTVLMAVNCLCGLEDGLCGLEDLSLVGVRCTAGHPYGKLAVPSLCSLHVAQMHYQFSRTVLHAHAHTAHAGSKLRQLMGTWAVMHAPDLLELGFGAATKLCSVFSASTPGLRSIRFPVAPLVLLSTESPVIRLTQAMNLNSVHRTTNTLPRPYPPLPRIAVSLRSSAPC